MVRTAVVSQMCINVGVIVFSVKNTFINLDLSTPNPYHFQDIPRSFIFELRCGQTDTQTEEQTNRAKHHTHANRLPRREPYSYRIKCDLTIEKKSKNFVHPYKSSRRNSIRRGEMRRRRDADGHYCQFCLSRHRTAPHTVHSQSTIVRPPATPRSNSPRVACGP